MKNILTIFATFLCFTTASAQDAPAVLQLVEQNNVSLQRYAAQCRAAKLEAHSGITLADPEVEFNYLWGSPTDVGERKDIAVSQSFDFATLFGARRREARSKADLADIEYAQARLMVLYSAQQVLIDLTAANRSVETLRQRLATARQMEQKYNRMLAEGEVAKPEVVRMSLCRATAEAELQQKEAERGTLLLRLRSLCNDSIDYGQTLFPREYLRGDLTLAVAQQESEVARQQVTTARQQGLPGLKVGYMSELTREEKFRGVSFGVSVPLWSNRRNVARARANYEAAAVAVQEQQYLLDARRKELHARAASLSSLCNGIRQSLSTLDATPLLQKALAAGEVSLVEYLADRSTYYDMQDRLLSVEADYQHTLAELSLLERQ